LKIILSDLNKRFDNKLLKDTVFRVGREPMRKIGRNERIVGAINLCLENNIFPEKICFVLSTALCYNYSLDEEAVKLQKIIEEKGIDFVLNEICEIKNREIINKVKDFYRELKNEMCNIKRN
jgi:mannitol-1-phosphate 5-dehydrogenase